MKPILKWSLIVGGGLLAIGGVVTVLLVVKKKKAEKEKEAAIQAEANAAADAKIAESQAQTGVAPSASQPSASQPSASQPSAPKTSLATSSPNMTNNTYKPANTNTGFKQRMDDLNTRANEALSVATTQEDVAAIQSQVKEELAATMKARLEANLPKGARITRRR